MVNIIQNKIETLKYGYAPSEFMPIMSGDQLLNKSAYYRYKARCIFVKRSLV